MNDQPNDPFGRGLEPRDVLESVFIDMIYHADQMIARIMADPEWIYKPSVVSQYWTFDRMRAQSLRTLEQRRKDAERAAARAEREAAKAEKDAARAAAKAEREAARAARAASGKSRKKKPTAVVQPAEALPDVKIDEPAPRIFRMADFWPSIN